MKNRKSIISAAIILSAICFLLAACKDDLKKDDSKETVAKSRGISITAEAIPDKENDGTPLVLGGERYEVLQDEVVLKGSELTAENGAIGFEYKAAGEDDAKYSSVFPTENGAYLVRVRIAASEDGVWAEAVSEGKPFNLVQPVQRTKMNLKGLWYCSQEGVYEETLYNDPYIIDPSACIFIMGDVTENDNTVRLCYNPDNFKYAARAKDYIGNLIGQNGLHLEWALELRVGSYEGTALARWQGYESYGFYKYDTYEDGKELMWVERHFINLIGRVDERSEYIEFESLKDAAGYTDENGGWICKEKELDVYVVRTMAGVSHQYNKNLPGSQVFNKVPDRAWQEVQSSFWGLPHYWWYITIEEGQSPRTLLFNSNLMITVFDSFGNVIASGHEGRIELTFDKNLTTSSTTLNTYYILIDNSYVFDWIEPECKMNLCYVVH